MLQAAFPVLAHALVIEFGGGRRDGDLRRAGIGAQAQIDAEDVAIGGGFGQKLQQALHQIDRRDALLATACEDKSLVVIENDEIDIAGIVQLESAHLAHGEDDEAGAVLESLGRCRV